MGFFTPNEAARLAKTTVRVAQLVQFSLDDGAYRWWNGDTDLEAGGHIWKPLRGAGLIDGLSMNGRAESSAINFTLPGLLGSTGDEILSLATSETDVVTGRVATVFLQFFDDNFQVVGSPLGVAWGYLQKPKTSRTVVDGLEGAVQQVSISAENVFYNRSRPPAGRYTDRDQQTRHPGDKMCQFVAQLAAPGYTTTFPDF